MKLSRCLIALLLIPGLAFAQTEPVTAPPDDSAMSVRPESQAPLDTAEGEGSETPDGVMDGIRNEEIKRNTPVVPTVSTPTTTDSGGSSSNNMGALMALGVGAIGLCGSLLGGNNERNVEEFTEAVDKMNDEQGNRYHPDYDEGLQKSLGTHSSAYLAKGCTNFVDKDGKVGPWGHDALVVIQNNPKSYSSADQTPPEISKLCPGYHSRMDKNQRDVFWLWIFSSLASSESGCDPAAINRKCNREDAARTGCKYNPNSPPNGDAIGLFQLEPKVCPGMSAQDLQNPHKNTRCAANVLARELMNRDQLLDYKKETYWGPLRGNTKHKGDGSASQKFLSLIPKYPLCGGGGR